MFAAKSSRKNPPSISLFSALLTTALKSARKRQIQASLQKAREYRRRRVSSDNSVTATPITSASAAERSVKPSDMVGLLFMSESALDTDNEDVDPSFDLDASMKSDSDHMIKSFCEDWISHLD